MSASVGVLSVEVALVLKAEIESISTGRMEKLLSLLALPK